MNDLKPARILAIETSCDETACAILENGRALLASTVASQMDIHARYGGVFPEVASRQHVLSIIPVVEQTLVQSNPTLKAREASAVQSRTERCGCDGGQARSRPGGFAGRWHEHGERACAGTRIAAGGCQSFG